MKIQTLIAALAFGIAGASFAQAPAAPSANTPKVDQRQANQDRRIQQGVASGQLTPREAAKLQRGQDRVAAKEAKAKADGVVTAKERRKLDRAQDRQSRKIHREKHDRQRVGGPSGKAR